MWSEMGDREGNLESGGPGFTQRSMGAPGAVGPPTPGLWLFIPQPSPPHTLGSQRTWRCPGKAQRTRLEGVYLAAKANEETLTVQSEVPGKPLPFQYFPCASALVADTPPLALNLGVKHCLSFTPCFFLLQHCRIFIHSALPSEIFSICPTKQTLLVQAPSPCTQPFGLWGSLPALNWLGQCLKARFTPPQGPFL